MIQLFPGRRFLFILPLLFLWTILFQGIPEAPAENSREFKDWLKDFKKEALSTGISANTLDNALTGIDYNSRVIELDRNQPEFKLTLSEYLDRMVSDSRIKKGREKLNANLDLLKKIQKRYGVPPRYLVALWGMESGYCRNTGDFDIVEALATLSYDPRRSLFFKKELLAALHLLDHNSVSLAELKGSWAGALGCLQFLPSVFLEHGVDFNKDGRLEVFKAGGDLFASGASYLKESGWQTGSSWGAEVLVPGSIDQKLLSSREPQPVSFWLEHGVEFKDSNKNPGENVRASLIQPDDRERRYFLIFGNFNVLLKWNRSDYYAIAAGILADRIKKKNRGGIDH
ncbi:MAG: lytic transglycosylase domain-containing protein [Desulfurivibrionaceae bacterium]